jgi:FkbM family methyltransferase
MRPLQHIGSTVGASARVLRRNIRFAFKKHITHNITAIDRWFEDRGDETLALQYGLTSSSVVFDVGGYKGVWSSTLATLYDPNLYVFEPVTEYFQTLQNRFATNPKVNLFHFGLGPRDEQVAFALIEDGSSLYAHSDRKEVILLRDIWSFVEEYRLAAIDLIQINIEGGEYELLRRMLETALTARCRHIRIQFHRVVPEATKMRQDIRLALSRTHELVYDYPFVWESWTARS